MESEKENTSGNKSAQYSGWVLDDAVLPNARIRQGDLIRFDSASEPLRKLAIVVTADCDLEQIKHGRTLTLVPVVDVQSIFEIYLIPDDLEKKRELIENFIFKHLSIEQSQSNDVKYAILQDRFSGSGSIQPSELALAASFLLNVKTELSLTEYAAVMAAIKTKGRRLDGFKDQLRNRGDLFILPEASSLGIQGHIAWVRQLWQIPASHVALRTSELASRPGERIARLDSPFRYRLTQLLAQVFSDIGLPDIPDSINRILEETYQNA